MNKIGITAALVTSLAVPTNQTGINENINIHSANTKENMNIKREEQAIINQVKLLQNTFSKVVSNSIKKYEQQILEEIYTGALLHNTEYNELPFIRNEAEQLTYTFRNITETIINNAKDDFNKDLETKKQTTKRNSKRKKSITVFPNATITTYNPVRGQTDDTPCINEATMNKLKRKFGTGNLCILNKRGIKTAAAPQDRLDYVLGKKTTKQKRNAGKIIFSIGDRIQITGGKDPKCNGIFYVADAFNKKHNDKQKIDVFKNSKKDNTLCTGAKVTLLK